MTSLLRRSQRTQRETPALHGLESGGAPYPSRCPKQSLTIFARRGDGLAVRRKRNAVELSAPRRRVVPIRATTPSGNGSPSISPATGRGIDLGGASAASSGNEFGLAGSSGPGVRWLSTTSPTTNQPTDQPLKFRAPAIFNFVTNQARARPSASATTHNGTTVANCPLAVANADCTRPSLATPARRSTWCARPIVWPGQGTGVRPRRSNRVRSNSQPAPPGPSPSPPASPAAGPLPPASRPPNSTGPGEDDISPVAAAILRLRRLARLSRQAATYAGSGATS